MGACLTAVRPVMLVTCIILPCPVFIKLIVKRFFSLDKFNSISVKITSHHCLTITLNASRISSSVYPYLPGWLLQCCITLQKSSKLKSFPPPMETKKNKKKKTTLQIWCNRNTFVLCLKFNFMPVVIQEYNLKRYNQNYHAW